MRKILYFISGLFMATSTIEAQKIHQLSANTYVKEFLVAGPFHGDLEADNWPDLLEIDFLENEQEFGSSETNVETRVVAAGSNNAMDLNAILGDSAVALAYAHFKISSPETTTALLLLAAQDGAKIYVNGDEVHTFFGGGWGSNESFYVNLIAGENNVVVKVPNRDWGWNLSVKVLDQTQAKVYLADQAERSDHISYLHSELQPQIDQNYSFSFRPGKFPKLAFDQPELVKKYLGGSFKINTRWFDTELNEVNYPRSIGRHAYYAEIEGKNGIKLRRAGTLFCAPQDWMGWNERLKSKLEYFPVNGISEDTWRAHEKAISEFTGFSMLKSILLQQDGHILLAFIDEAQKQELAPDPLISPSILNGDYHARLKQKILGVENKYPSLKYPRTISMEAPRLVQVNADQNKTLHAKLREIAKAWMQDDGGPFDMVIAQDGQMIFHESFGQNEYGPFTTETPSEIASITKLFTGLLFAQFVDQGIIGIDDPVGKYLPDFPISGPKALTLRHCFTHTSGFYGHGLFGGVHNPWLDNTLFQAIRKDTVGTTHNYNGMGYNLAGKVMEIVSGKSIFRLFREYLYDPLEMENTVHDWDLGYSIHSTAFDLAKVAQLLLNKGTYGNKQFFTEETFEKLLPAELNEFYSGINQKWGIGITMMNWKVKDESGEERFLLSDNMIGHGSATASIFWVDQKNNLIITQSRRRAFRNFGKHFQEMIEVIEDYLPEITDKTKVNIKK